MLKYWIAEQYARIWCKYKKAEMIYLATDDGDVIAIVAKNNDCKYIKVFWEKEK